MKTQILLLVFGLVFVVRAAPHHDLLHKGIKFAMKELEKLEEDAEAALDDFFKEVHPDVEEAMNVAGITEEDLDEAEEEAEEALEEAEDEVEKLDISVDDVEDAAEDTDVVSAKHHHGHLHKGIKFTMKELEKLEEDAEAALDDFFKEVHPDVEEAMNVAGITEEDLDEAEEEAEEALEEAEDEVEKLDISVDDVEDAAEDTDVVSAKHHHGHLHKGIKFTMKELEKLEEDAEAPLDDFFKEVHPDVEEAMNVAGITEEDLDEAEEEAEDEVEKLDISEDDVEHAAEAADVVSAKHHHGHLHKGIKFTMKELEKLEEDAEAPLDDFFKEVHPDVEEAMNVAGITEEDLDEAEEEAEDEVEKLDISEDDVEHAAEAADVVSAKHHHGHLHKGIKFTMKELEKLEEDAEAPLDDFFKEVHPDVEEAMNVAGITEEDLDEAEEEAEEALEEAEDEVEKLDISVDDVEDAAEDTDVVSAKHHHGHLHKGIKFTMKELEKLEEDAEAPLDDFFKEVHPDVEEAMNVAGITEEDLDEAEEEAEDEVEKLDISEDDVEHAAEAADVVSAKHHHGHLHKGIKFTMKELEKLEEDAEAPLDDFFKEVHPDVEEAMNVAGITEEDLDEAEEEAEEALEEAEDEVEKLDISVDDVEDAAQDTDVVSAKHHHGHLHKEILKMEIGAEKGLEDFVKEVNPGDYEKVISEAGITKEDANEAAEAAEEAGEQAEKAGEEAAAEVEKGNVSENDAENWFESTYEEIEKAI